jgi:hypothetical protein
METDRASPPGGYWRVVARRRRRRSESGGEREDESHVRGARIRHGLVLCLICPTKLFFFLSLPPDAGLYPKGARKSLA